MKTQKKINRNVNDTVIKTSLSFEFLIEELEQIVLNGKHPLFESASKLLAGLDNIPEIKTQINDLSLLEKNKDLVEQMMAFVINPLTSNTAMEGATVPFHKTTFFSTEQLRAITNKDEYKLEIAKNHDLEEKQLIKIYFAYLIILEQIYNYKTDFNIPLDFKLTNEQNQRVQYFRKNFNYKYLRVGTVGKLKRLTDEQLKKLLDNIADLSYWRETLPLESFEFKGFVHFSFTKSTYDFVVSELKSNLLDNKTILTNEGFELIQNHIRALIEMPNLKIGLAAIDQFDSTINKSLIWKTLIDRSKLSCREYSGTFYEQAMLEKKIVITNDFNEAENDRVVAEFLNHGIRSHVIVPLVLDGETVGMLEFASENKGELDMVKVSRLKELFPVFAVALKRSKNECKDRESAIIQQHFTAIHPSVEWRFREAVVTLMNENSTEKLSTGIEPVVFDNIIPIFGASDIHSSTTERNKAIQSDFLEQLEYAREIIEYGKLVNEMPFLDAIHFEIRNFISTVKNGLKAGDEFVIIEFLKNEVEPAFKLLKDRFQEMEKPVNDYLQKIDTENGVLYKKRKEFEDSLTSINKVIGKIIDDEQIDAQKIFPHYFEKYSTDGVEYNAYIGQSLVKKLKYNGIYLKNIRLWQLLLKVRIAQEIRKLQSELPVKLDITQLILVHSQPLSIAFRQDEKKFDVAGAYNIRYEITKKRIDKALIKATKERITEVGKIAIIYSHADEITEYKKYIDYLISLGLITQNVENFELEDLTGASGLRALRIEVNFENNSLLGIKKRPEISVDRIQI
ncbi:GAF domain-containing protein [Maribellus comscasis]|uniref:GAF domain-containing protein n=1 Tax=Maribellus comscasis TaxID=2681766 RepID=A0A6I6JNL7_9BACT|nr:GAF domain-containing protein [Maribellus comscasis]QGY44041.1 GAF domain-containing protein [Maribellus comscasis]